MQLPRMSPAATLAIECAWMHDRGLPIMPWMHHRESKHLPTLDQRLYALACRLQSESEPMAHINEVTADARNAIRWWHERGIVAPLKD